MISDSQKRLLFAKAKEGGWTPEQLKKLLLMRYKTDRTSDLTLPNFEFLLQLLAGSKPSQYGIE